VKILVLDIETRPHLAHVWSLWDENIPLARLIESGTVICFAAKWLGEKKVYFGSDFHDGHGPMLQLAWNLINEADAIVTYNGIAFDMKHLAREFLLAGLSPPSPYHDIDLYRAVRNRFKFASNKLDHVSKQLGIGSKVKHDGFDLWVACIAGDEKAWRKMKQYNIGDVRLTERVHNTILPWIPRYPNVALHTSSFMACPKCGSEDVTRQGQRTTGAGVFQQFKCKECGGWSRSASRMTTTGLRGV
jgi:predicted RNA-binding Zn-ribbon protein involved in translation (DUF1610 family)